MKTMNLTPNYQAVFELAKQITSAEIPENEGRELVLEMLNYGQRMDKVMTDKREAE